MPRLGGQGRIEVTRGQCPWSSQGWEPGSNEASILRKDLGGKDPGVRQLPVGNRRGEIYLRESSIPVCGLFPWWGSPSEAVQIIQRPELCKSRWQKSRGVQSGELKPMGLKTEGARYTNYSNSLKLQ